MLSKLLLRLIEYRLDQLNTKDINTIITNTRQYKFLKVKEMSGKSLNIFGPPTAKWQLFQISAKFNRNDFSMANILKLQKYKAIGLMKMHNMNNIWFAINKFSLWKNWFRINGPFTIVFFNFCLFHFFKFPRTIIKVLMEKWIIIMDFIFKILWSSSTS